MMPACNKGAGQSIGFPDVCLTPAAPSPVPVPYPNIDMNATRMPPSPNVFISMVPTYNMLATSPMTSGMEGGAAHPLFKGAGRMTMGNPKIFVNSLPAANLLCPTSGNNFNNPVGATLVPSVTNVLFTQLPREDSRSVLPDPCNCALAEIAPGVFGASISLFSMTLTSRLALALERLSEPGSPAPTLILDLRSCPGGEFAAFTQLSDDFLPINTPLCIETSGIEGEGPGASTTTGRDEDLGLEAAPSVHQRLIRTRQSDPHESPLVLLVDHETASAAELFAACMKFHRRATIVGSRTYGKAEAQQWVAADVGPGTYATVARYALPDGSAIHGVGVEPDLRVSPGEDALSIVIDRAVQGWG